jgi:hypothetical protein
VAAIRAKAQARNINCAAVWAHSCAIRSNAYRSRNIPYQPSLPPCAKCGYFMAWNGKTALFCKANLAISRLPLRKAAGSTGIVEGMETVPQPAGEMPSEWPQSALWRGHG